MKEIDGYDGKYLVDEYGNVYSIRRQGCKGQKLSQRVNNTGYMRVDLRNGKEKRSVFVHRLVAESFIYRPDGCNYVNHKDGNKLNNNVSNLEWCTQSENMKHAIRTGLNHVPALNREKHPMHKLTENDVKKIHELRMRNTKQAEIARMFNVTPTQIHNIVSGKQWR